MKILLELKAKLKSTLKRFTRKDSHKKVRVGDSKWRKPKGITNKMRLQKRGHKRIVKTGFGTPATLRDTNKKGLRSVLISNMKDLETIDSKIESVIISGKVSKKNRLVLLQTCIDKKIVVDNVDPAKKIAEIKNAYDNKVKGKKDKVKVRQDKKAALDVKEKKAAEKKAAKKAPVKTEDADAAKDAKEQEKIDKAKILTQKA